ncbi:hypothetical protein [Marinactinospora rubrisoli]|uniref:Uncharacterized protein n=1 Tax=Marinactinospora rubrisoli TaxID=2715399 RepID=A0ABW2KPX6_9ACTN
MPRPRATPRPPAGPEDELGVAELLAALRAARRLAGATARVGRPA